MEFIFDYVDPQDCHDNSYFRHMDEYERKIHHERVRPMSQSARQTTWIANLANQGKIMENSDIPDDRTS